MFDEQTVTSKGHFWKTRKSQEESKDHPKFPPQRQALPGLHARFNSNSPPGNLGTLLPSHTLPAQRQVARAIFRLRLKLRATPRRHGASAACLTAPHSDLVASNPYTMSLLSSHLDSASEVTWPRSTAQKAPGAL